MIFGFGVVVLLVLNESIVVLFWIIMDGCEGCVLC